LDSIDEQLKVADIRNHIDRIRTIAQTKTYCEIGYQNSAAIPLLIREFHDRIRIVHIFRNTVLNAYSLATHGFYNARNSVEQARNDLCNLDPREDNVAFPHYADKWDQLNPFSKSVYFWLEINTYALELQQGYRKVPFRSVRAENLFSSPYGLTELLSWMGLPEDERAPTLADQVVDNHHKKTTLSYDIKEIIKVPEALDLARRLGYDDSELIDRSARSLDRYKTRLSVPYSVHKIVSRFVDPRIIRNMIRNMQMFVGFGFVF
jgi:hypothetical protein